MTTIHNRDWLDSFWPLDFFKGKDPMICAPTAVTEDILTHIAAKVSEVPPDFNIHPRILFAA